MDEQDWAKEWPLGAGGKIEEHWLENRKNWLDEDGVPEKPDWTVQSAAVAAQEERERTYCENYEKEHDILVCADEQDVFDELPDALSMHPKMREMRFRNELDRTTSQGGGLVAGLSSKGASAEELQEALGEVAQLESYENEEALRKA